jgi:excisionase family DNA binding protein
VRDLARLLSADLVAEIERIVDSRIEETLAARGGENGGSPWLTVGEAGENLRVSERQVHRLLTRGRIRSTCIGRRRLLHRDDLDSFLRGGAAEG